MDFPARHDLPDGTAVFTGAESPFDENGVDLTLVDAMLAMSPEERLALLASALELAESLRSGLAPGSDEAPGAP